MTTINLHDSFARLPGLAALHQRLVQASHEQSGMVFVASVPFMVSADGSLYKGTLHEACFIFMEDLDDEAVLYKELCLIAQGVTLGRYSLRHLSYLESWSTQILPIIDALAQHADLYTAHQHGVEHLLH